MESGVRGYLAVPVGTNLPPSKTFRLENEPKL